MKLKKLFSFSPFLSRHILRPIFPTNLRKLMRRYKTLFMLLRDMQKNCWPCVSV